VGEVRRRWKLAIGHAPNGGAHGCAALYVAAAKNCVGRVLRVQPRVGRRQRVDASSARWPHREITGSA
jgi:hypothetical protein